MAPSTCSKPTCGVRILMRRAERPDQVFGRKPEKRLVDSHKIDVIRQKSTTRHKIFQLIRSSFDRPNANEMKLSCRRIRPFQQRVYPPPAPMKVVVLVGNRCFRGRRVMSGELGQVRTRSASCISTCISIVLWIHPRALPGYAIEASPGIAPGPCSAPLAVPFSRPPGPRQPPSLAPAAGSSELPARGARRPGSGAAVALAAV